MPESEPTPEAAPDLAYPEAVTEMLAVPDAPVDVAQLTDLTVLKAMAYDYIAQLEQVQGGLQLINARIHELQTNASV